MEEQKRFEAVVEEAKQIEATRYTNLPRAIKFVVLVLSLVTVGIAVFFIFTLNIAGKVLMDFGYFYLLFATLSTCAFLLIPARKKDGKRVPWYDLIAAALNFGISMYFFMKAMEIGTIGWVPAAPLNFALAVVMSLLLLEGGRRTGGIPFLLVCVIAGIYPVWADKLPGVFYGMSFPFRDLLSHYVFTAAGLLGLPARVVGTTLIGFLIFAGMLVASGAGDFFYNLALALFGRFRGGPAKVSVVSSGFFGSLSGSVFSNIISTGTFTIPAMKRTGYPAHYAAAVEACASTGGPIMPPVMGAIAFIMAIFLGVEYRVVMLAAIIPAILYYWGLLVQVDSYAARVGLKGMRREEIPSIRAVLKKGWVFIAVLIFLVWGLLYMRWESLTPFYGSALLFILSFTRKETMMTPRRLIKVITSIGELLTQTWSIIMPIGFVIAGLTITGTSVALTSVLIKLGGGNLYIVLLIGVVACYVMGMVGLVATAYIFLAVTLAPAIVQIGHLNVIAVHFLIIYYANLAGITPPVAIGSFLAAKLADAPPMKTAIQSMRMGVVIYFVPWFFVFKPSLVLQGPIVEAIYLFILCFLGIWLIASGIEGYLVWVGRLGVVSRLLLVIGGFLFAFPEWTTTYIGAALSFAVIATLLLMKRHRKPKAIEPSTN